MMLPALLASAAGLWWGLTGGLPVRGAALLFARLSLNQTRADGGPGRYGRVWGRWRRAAAAPGPGYFQPDYACAEYVLRSLRAAGVPVPTPRVGQPGWPDLVNVDRAVASLWVRGWVRPAALSRLRPGDLVAVRFLRWGTGRWSHLALVLRHRPLRLAAHNPNRWGLPLEGLRTPRTVLGLALVPHPRPPEGLRPLRHTPWAEVDWRDPPLRLRPGGPAVGRLYLGQVVRLMAIARAPGSRTGWLHVASGSRRGWVNGDWLTRLRGPLPSLGPAGPVLRGYWGNRVYVDGEGRPVPAWTGAPRDAPIRRVTGPGRFPRALATTRPVLLRLAPSPQSLAVARLPRGAYAAGERLGGFEALFALGGPRRAEGVLYAPAGAFRQVRRPIALTVAPVRIAGRLWPAETAAVIQGGRLHTAQGTWPMPYILPPEVVVVSPSLAPSWVARRLALAAASLAVLAGPSPALGAPSPDTPIRMAERTTTYPHSPPDRNHNLAVGARILDGRVLPPGAVLSFNAALGPTTPERGFRYGPVFYGNRVGRGLGGGVCQIASTLYVAARGANLRILERHHHGLRVPYLPPGEDATVSAGYLDLRIQNSTPGPVRLSVTAKGPSLTVALYGTVHPPRTWFYHRTLDEWPPSTLRLPDPHLPQGTERVEAPGSGGVLVHTWFAVRGPDGRTQVEDLGIDRYRASPRIVRYGTAPPAVPSPPAAG